MSLDRIRAMKVAAAKKKDKNKGKTYRIPFRTKKQAKTIKSLGEEYEIYLETRPDCAIRSEVCTGRATAVNHIKGRGEKVVHDQKFWEPCCPPCNGYIESHDKWAQEHGHKVSRLAK